MDGVTARADAIDVLGVSMGMPVAELQQVIQKNGWSCKQVNVTFYSGYSCQPQAAENSGVREIKIQTTKFLTNVPVDRMIVLFSTAENPIPGLIKKFGRPLISHGADGYWKLSDGSELTLESGGTDHVLKLEKQELISADSDAERKQSAPYSTPKF
jgi:hypothetical protein